MPRTASFVLMSLLTSSLSSTTVSAVSQLTARCVPGAVSTITTSADLACIELLPTDLAPEAMATVELVRAASPFGVAVTAEGRQRWRLRLVAEGLPEPSSVGGGHLVAWATTPALAPVVRLGVVGNGTNDLAEIGFNKFIVWVSVEVDPDTVTREGPLLLRGSSPSSRMHPEDLLTQSPMSILQGAEGHGSNHDMGGMPPMHPEVAPLPGVMALRPATTDWLPTAAELDQVPLARPRELVELPDGGTLDLEAGLVRRQIGNRVLLMYGFNGQYPGPLLKVPEKATIFVNFMNATELPTAVHWHGVRLDNRFDGVPGLTQEPVDPGGTFRYQIYFRDAGIYWYHPHHREDIAQDLGLYGNMLVEPRAPDYYNEVDAERVLMLDDLLLGDAGFVPYGAESSNYMLMGRFGNELLVNGEPRYRESARGGDTVRYFFTNVSNTRTFNLSFRARPEGEQVSGLGAARIALDSPPLPMRVVGADISRFEREVWADSLAIAPAERYVVEVQLPENGDVAMVNVVQGINHRSGEFFTEATEVGRVEIDGHNPAPRQVAPLRAHPAQVAEFDRPVDYELTLRLQTKGLPLVVRQLMALDRVYFNPVEWAGTMAMMNWVSTGAEVEWELLESSTGNVNDAITWNFEVGDVVKIRLHNSRDSFHAMQHPIHFHGQRVAVLDHDGVRNDNLAWKDTVLVPVGTTIDLLLEISNPGKWMVHCHIAEHLESGMKMVFSVAPTTNDSPAEENQQ
ncbi:MAG: multicopper oxidase domain-containing protein [Acidobacteria bacterium]|nr:multicopper oxidase domain-containing protein [Acidobacteriota bacterium]